MRGKYFRGLVALWIATVALGIVFPRAAWADAPQQNEQFAPSAKEDVPHQATTATESKVDRPDYRLDSCYEADIGNADLCAQWRSAVAAEKAADLAERANWINSIGAVIGLGTVGGLFVTIFQTRRALREAARGNRIALVGERRARVAARQSAEEMSAALKAAQEQAHAMILSQKAQPFVSNISLALSSSEDKTKLELILSFGNSGQSIYRMIKIASKIRLRATLEDNPSSLVWYDQEFSWPVPPKTVLHYSAKESTIDINHAELVSALAKRELGVWVYGAILIEDELVGRRTDRFCFQVVFREGSDLSHGFCHDGGDAYWKDIEIT